MNRLKHLPIVIISAYILYALGFNIMGLDFTNVTLQQIQFKSDDSLAWAVLLLRPKLLPKPGIDGVFLRGWPLLVLGAGSFLIGIMPWVDIVLTYLNGG